VLRQTLIEKGEIGRQQLRDTAAFTDDAIEEQFRLPDKILSKTLSKIRKEHIRGKCARYVSKT
tara:strand:- start:13 stop:201 length:189 start_codon:yes stop_codon:yes gene_type:complete